MQRTIPLLRRTLARGRGFSTSPSSSSEKIVASVLFERLPVVIPKIEPVVYAYQEFAFRWRQQYRRIYPDELLDKSNARSLQRALDRRLYLLLYGKTDGSAGKSVWQFPEKVYQSEETLRKCAESALKSVLGNLSHTYFVGNAPMGHMEQPEENIKQFFFKSQVIAANKFDIGKCEDFVWVTKDELIEYFPEKADFLNKMIIS
ncbi:uncharacterized protein [Pyrus communis]|uniref:uncharacterized protein isoform X2 n=1 Tax=Pyrus communis TaxID=23211 RepID=UPI0035C12660